MSFTRWLRNVKSAWQLRSRSGNGRPAARSRPAARFRPRLEALEERCLMSAGVLDTTFNPNGSPPGTVTGNIGGYANAVAIQPDGKIVAVGQVGVGQGVARYNPDGSLDKSFGVGGTVTEGIYSGLFPVGQDMALQSDGKIVVVGRFVVGGQPFGLTRYTTTGALDQSFGNKGTVTTHFFPGSIDQAYAVAIQPDGKIVVAGLSTGNGGNVEIALARYETNGQLDDGGPNDPTPNDSFGSGGKVLTSGTLLAGKSFAVGRDIAIDSAGRLVVVGYAGGGPVEPIVTRYHSNGSLDTSLGGTGIIGLSQFNYAQGRHAALQTDGKIILTEAFGDVIRLNANGSLDTASFGPLQADGTHTGYVAGLFPNYLEAGDVQVQSDGKIVVAASGQGLEAARLLSDGSLDPTFGAGGIALAAGFSVPPNALAIQPADGYIMLAGGGASGFGLARFVGDAPTPAGASALAVAYFPSTITAGLSRTFTVWAENAAGGTASGYTGTVHFTSSDRLAVLPADYTFTAADKGAHTFSATLNTIGTQSLFVTDTRTGSLAGSETGIAVIRASTFSVTGFPSHTTAGVPAPFTITARDASNNIATDYLGTVHFTSSDPQAVLPVDYTFTGADQGVHTFAATLKTAGTQSLTAMDTWEGSIAGSETGIAVTPAGASHFRISAPASVTHGVAFTLTVIALDPYGNVATGYTGTVHFTSSDGSATLPLNYTFTAADAGVHTFVNKTTLRKKGTMTISVGDTQDPDGDNDWLAGTDSIIVL